jgi:outer membrane protein OmpA-like peptidoglycan-associated protein
MLKYIISTAVIILLAGNCNAQLKELLKQKAAEGVKQGAQNSTENAADKAINKLFSKKTKKSKNAETTADSNANTTQDKNQNIKDLPQQPSVKTYSKYDFIPGEKILGYDDFSGDAVGDFPAKWNTNASGEIMTTDNYSGKWLNISKEGYYLPGFIKSIPDNFTIEFDLLFIPLPERSGPNTATVGLQLISKTGKTAFDYGPDRSYFELDPYMENINVATYTKMGEKLLANEFNVKGLNRNTVLTYHIAVWRQKNRLRVYLNENKVVDVPSLLSPDIKYNTVRFATSLNNDGSTWLISNFKFASGLPDTRNKLLTEGKFSTTGILFDVNAATIKPSSYGTLKDIAIVLKENSSLKVKIVGHTDSDGDGAANLALSKRRAEAVKNMLVNEFSIDESRIQTEGKGASQPAVPNTTSEGKAQNRRVEFIKI